MPDTMQYLYLYDRPEKAEAALAAGATLFIDLEHWGKAERQGHLDTHKALHTLDDVAEVGQRFPLSDAIVRTDPLHPGTDEQLRRLADVGVERVMLPMFHSADEVRDYADRVNGRFKIVLLLETARSMVRVREIARLGVAERIHIGLNDLSLELGLPFLFELLSAGIIEWLAGELTSAGIPFGFGGIGVLGAPGPVPALAVLSEHVRLGSSSVILSRAFRNVLDENQVRAELENLRSTEASLRSADAATLESHRRTVVDGVAGHLFGLAEQRRAEANLP